MTTPRLYHGTDARILKMSQSEIKAFKQDILGTLDYLWPLFEPYTVDHYHTEHNHASKRLISVQDMEYLKEPLGYDEDSTLYTETAMTITINSKRLNRGKLWQYDSLYLTNWDWQAWGYARRAKCFGELGMVAQTLIRSCNKINSANIS